MSESPQRSTNLGVVEGSAVASAGIDAHLASRIARLAAAPILLVASDFDGTLAGIVDNYQDANADPDSVRVLAELASLPHTAAAVISGRALNDLKSRLAAINNLHFIGSHGLESDGSTRLALTDGQRTLHSRVAEELADIARDQPGVLIEPKPASHVIHYRLAPPEVAERVRNAVATGPASLEGVYVLAGHKVLELAVIQPDKGRALNALRRAIGATSVLFIGDDVTDEAAFNVLGDADLGVRIGDGPTAAGGRITDLRAVPVVLEMLLRERRQWLASRRLTPIQAHSMLSDQRTIALLDPSARLVWMCMPRIDSPAMFASLLGGPSRGVFEIAAIPAPGESDASPLPQSQTYDGDSFIVTTRFRDFTLTDYLDCTAGRPFQRAGRCDLIRTIEGQGRVRITFAPRLDFGRAPTRLRSVEHGLEIDGWTDPVLLYAPGVSWRITEEGQHHTAFAEVNLDPARPLTLELRYGTASARPAVLPDAARRVGTHKFWAGWAGTLSIPPVRSDLVRRSALVLKALCHGPTGAIVAAGTTSLPEHLGGVRNWDYRYCWPRDAALAAGALVRLGNTGAAIKLLDWLIAVVEQCESPDRLRPIYTVSGHELGPEAEISELCGYGDSRPVRIGNAASNQVQIDVFGAIVDLVAVVAQAGAPITPEYWKLVQDMVAAVAQRWNEPDNGIWEVRMARRHHVHSKAMCWLAVDRAITVADLVTGRRRTDWELLRSAIAADVCNHGFDPDLRAFTTAYGEKTIDSSSLWVGLSGMLPPTDARFVSTVEAVERELRNGPVVYRYRFEDGLPGVEGAWVICATWLVESMLLVGRRTDAEELFEQVAALAGPTGLLTEEFDPRHGIALGNFPQAYSHLGIINAAVRLAQQRT